MEVLRYYAGIGSRNTPSHVLKEMERIATLLQDKLVLRSGAARGADTAFEKGAGRNKEIYVASGYDASFGYKVFGRMSNELRKHCFTEASLVHPAWDKVNGYGRLLHARNILQIEGMDRTFVDFVLYWTEYDKHGNPKGGTATAVNYARNNKIPTFNMNIDKELQAFWNFVSENYDVSQS